MSEFLLTQGTVQKSNPLYLLSFAPCQLIQNPSHFSFSKSDKAMTVHDYENILKKDIYSQFYDVDIIFT